MVGVVAAKLDFSDVLIVPSNSSFKSRKDVDLTRTFLFNNKQEWTGIPIVSANMTSVTTGNIIPVMEKHRMLACLPKHKEYLCIGEDRKTVICSYGMTETVPDNNSLFVCLDVANGYMEQFINRVYDIKRKYPNKIIIAGNVVTVEGMNRLFDIGADIVKIGIGSGSACTTRLMTGVGYPQFSAIEECAEHAHHYPHLRRYIMSDGGCIYPGDIAKAFVAGADFVMLGGMLAGHDENGTKFYGMSSEVANKEFAGGLKNYRTPEGWELELPSRGKLDDTLNQIEGGLRSTCAYVGRNLHGLKYASVIEVNNQNNQSLVKYAK